MTGYQRFVVIGQWMKAGKPMPLDEFAATQDIKAIKDPSPRVHEPKPKTQLEIVSEIFGT